MHQLGLRIYRIVTGLVLLIAGILTVAPFERAPVSVIAGLLLVVWPLIRAWSASRGTALRSAVVWGGIAVGLGIVSQVVALGEPLTSGRPTTAYCTYLATLATLAALISVLGARTPGAGAWAILMVLLIVVFLIPWLEGRLRLEQPWNLFYALLVLTGVTNYVLTEYRAASVALAIGFYAEYYGLSTTRLSPETLSILSSIVPFTFAVAIFAADLATTRRSHSSSRLEAIWFWFRDHWGVVWALRVQERFNKSAAAQGWPIRLSWHGVVASDGGKFIVPSEAEATLKSLLRRFAELDRIEEAVAEVRE